MRPLTALICDFDETITAQDTTPVIASTASPPPECPPWAHFFETYLQDYHTHQPPPIPSQDELKKSTCRDEIASRLAHYLDSYKDVERQSHQRVWDAKALEGSTRQKLREAGRKVRKREGWDSFIKAWVDGRSARQPCPTIESHEDDPHSDVWISSVNWSRDLVHSAVTTPCPSLSANSLNPEPSPLSSLPHSHILANDLEFSTEGPDEQCTGRVMAEYMSGADKLRKVKSKLKSLDGCIYIGDSVSDVPCMFAATLGILIRPSQSVSRLCLNFQIPLHPLPANLADCNPDTIYVADDGWRQIQKVVCPTS
ncbi:hypothetical protein DFS34DRAFT_649918 [Phlyctochytrium arcticum]|nr:hypothetical protein DFS34DRAFT_649918 [Phlyctochytrium arcticum]